MSNAPSRLLGTTTAAAGLLLLCRPQHVSRLAAGSTGTNPPTWLVRLLGARYVVQGAAELARPSKPVWLLASATDVMHAISMVGVAAMRPPFRRAALASAAAASGSAAATAAAGLHR